MVTKMIFFKFIFIYFFFNLINTIISNRKLIIVKIVLIII